MKRLWKVLLVAAAVLSGQRAAAADLGAYRQLSSDTYLLVLRPGAKLVESLKVFQAAAHVESGAVTGVGVTRNTVLGFYKFNADGTPAKTHVDDTVTGAREIVSLNCVLTTTVREDGKPDAPAAPHCHIALAGVENPVADGGHGWPVVGGHLIEAEVGVTAELIVTTYPADVVKRPSASFGGVVIDLETDPRAVPLSSAN